MTEGRIYVCTWTRTDEGFRLWVKRRPRIAAEAATFDEADELLHDAILDALGDGESVVEYDPPRPVAADAGVPLRSRLALVFPESSAHMVDAASLFENGLCTQCHQPLGPRTDVPLAVERIDGPVDGITARLKRPYGSGPNLRCFSEDFLALLEPSERSRFEWRPLRRQGRQKRNFFELVVMKPPLPFVALKGVGATLTECDSCGWKEYPFYSFWPDPPSRYVAADDLPARVPGLLAVGHALEPELCATKKRWSAMVGLKGARGLKSYDVGVLDRSAIDRRPPYTLLSES